MILVKGWGLDSRVVLRCVRSDIAQCLGGVSGGNIVCAMSSIQKCTHWGGMTNGGGAGARRGTSEAQLGETVLGALTVAAEALWYCQSDRHAHAHLLEESLTALIQC